MTELWVSKSQFWLRRFGNDKNALYDFDFHKYRDFETHIYDFSCHNYALVLFLFFQVAETGFLQLLNFHPSSSCLFFIRLNNIKLNCHIWSALNLPIFCWTVFFCCCFFSYYLFGCYLCMKWHCLHYTLNNGLLTFLWSNLSSIPFISVKL